MSDPLRLSLSQRTTSTDVPIGIRFSAILLALWACVLGLCGLFCLITVVITSMHGDRSEIFLGVGFVFAFATALFCLRAARALLNAERWGANVATVCGGLAVAFGCLVILNFFHIGRQSADEYFLYPVAPIFLLLGAWLCIYLNMPRVRSSFERRLD
jgi:hypothetical protein